MVVQAAGTHVGIPRELAMWSTISGFHSVGRFAAPVGLLAVIIDRVLEESSPAAQKGDK